jgi:hypothetical protein
MFFEAHVVSQIQQLIIVSPMWIEIAIFFARWFIFVYIILAFVLWRARKTSSRHTVFLRSGAALGPVGHGQRTRRRWRREDASDADAQHVGNVARQASGERCQVGVLVDSEAEGKADTRASSRDSARHNESVLGMASFCRTTRAADCSGRYGFGMGWPVRGCCTIAPYYAILAVASW